MFDILVFLFENYFHAGTYPDQATLSIRLCAAGFDSRDISQALTWLSGLERVGNSGTRSNFTPSKGFRFYTEPELSTLTTEARGFLLFLESAGVISVLQRDAGLFGSGRIDFSKPGTLPAIVTGRRSKLVT